MNVAGDKALAELRDGDHVLGAEDPELVLIEYGDFGCPYCFAASRPLKSLVQRYDTLSLVWRHLPDADLHPGADLAAEFSELAAARGLFWQAHSLLLTGRDQFSLDDLYAVGEELELNGGEADSALRERAYRGRVAEDVAEAKRANVHGTPTFFLGGERLKGHWSQLARLIPARLDK